MTASRKSCASLLGVPNALVRRCVVFNNLLDHGETLSAIAVEQLLVAVAVQNKIELPNQIPNVMQAGVHPLSPKRTVNVSGVAGYEDMPDAKLSDMAVMDVKICAPMQCARFKVSGYAFSQYLLHHFERWHISFRVLD